MKHVKCQNISPIFREKECSEEELVFLPDENDVIPEMNPNDYFILRNCYSESGSAIVYKTNYGSIKLVELPPKLPIKPLFAEHHAALHALLVNDQVKIVILYGKAGSGKSYITMGCGLYSVQKEIYDNIILIRNNVPASTHTLGLLPGDLGEKMGPWFGPADDILEELLDLPLFQDMNGGQGGISPSKSLMYSGALYLNTPEYLRGSSKHNRYVIVDDFQNFTRGETDLIITRFGKNCKIVLCGDPSQVDNGLSKNTDNSGLDMIRKMRIWDEPFAGISCDIEFNNGSCRGEVVEIYANARAKLN